MKQSTLYFLLVGLHLAAAEHCEGPAADAAPADPALDAASGVVMLATKSVVSKLSLLEDGATVSTDIKGIEAEATLITRVLRTPRGSSEIEPALLEGLATMKITPQVATFIKATLATLAPVFGNISEASANATKLCDKMHASFAELDRELNSTKQKVKSLEESAISAGKVHGMCRSSESSAWAAKTACDLQKEVLQQKLKMATVEVQAQQEAQKAAVCGTSKNDVTVDNEDFVKKLKDRADAMAKAGKDFLELKANYTAKGKECVGLSDGHVAKKAACDQDQKDLEAAVCKQGSTAQDGCKVYESTFQTRLSDYQNVIDNVALQQADRLSEWKHLKRIECVLSTIGSAKAHGDLKAGGNLASQIQACYGKPFHNSGLIVAAKPAPSQQSCPSVPELPCTAAFISQSYGGLPQDAPAATCSNGCAATTTTITTTVTATTTTELKAPPLKTDPPTTSKVSAASVTNANCADLPQYPASLLIDGNRGEGQKFWHGSGQPRDGKPNCKGSKWGGTDVTLDFTFPQKKNINLLKWWQQGKDRNVTPIYIQVWAMLSGAWKFIAEIKNDLSVGERVFDISSFACAYTDQMRLVLFGNTYGFSAMGRVYEMEFYTKSEGTAACKV